MFCPEVVNIFPICWDTKNKPYGVFTAARDDIDEPYDNASSALTKLWKFCWNKPLSPIDIFTPAPDWSWSCPTKVVGSISSNRITQPNNAKYKNYCSNS